MTVWVQQCPNCGYSARDVSVFDPRLREFLDSPEYKQVLANKAYPSLAAKFVGAALLLEVLDQLIEAGWEHLHAAWNLDDVGNQVESTRCRNQATRCWVKAMETPDLNPSMKTELCTVMVDCLRRAGRGREAVSLIDRTLAGGAEGVIGGILKFQRELIGRDDRGKHTIDEIKTLED